MLFRSLATLDAGQIWAFRLTANPSYCVYRVYVGMTLEQEAGMGQWPVASGHGDVLVNVHRPATGADAPLWLTIGFTGVALLAIPLLVWILQREVQALRPLARNLTAMGMPESWARRVLSGVIGPVLAVPLGLGLIAGARLDGAAALALPDGVRSGGRQLPRSGPVHRVAVPSWCAGREARRPTTPHV